MSTVYRQSIEPRTDWFRVLVDLKSKGIGHRGVARQLRVSKSTIYTWKSGTEPRHSDGEQLIALWCTATGMPRTQLPVRSPYDWR